VGKALYGMVVIYVSGLAAEMISEGSGISARRLSSQRNMKRLPVR